MTKRTERAGRTQTENGAGPEPAHLVEPMLAGMTMRYYEDSLEARPSEWRTRGSSKSAVSRTVVRRTRQRLHEQITRRLEGREVGACSWMASWSRSRR